MKDISVAATPAAGDLWALRSFIESANQSGSDFPIQNLPFCVFRPIASTELFRIGVGIGHMIVDLSRAVQAGLLDGLALPLRDACHLSQMNVLCDLGRPVMATLRLRLQELLAADSLCKVQMSAVLVEQAAVEFDVPFQIGDYTDFFASVNHATNVGKMYRPDTPLLPNFKTQPLAYHGRASSIGVSGEVLLRPQGQYRDGHGGELKFAPTARLDFEVELGAYIGRGNRRGDQIGLDQAEGHIAGVCIVNDWSARDIQAWETQPLGPFLGKNFATTVSPWVVSLDALEPFRAPAASEAEGEAALATYLRSDQNRQRGGIAIQIETFLQTEAMRLAGSAGDKIATTLFSRDSYWTLGQMLAHHTVNGCNLRSGDLLASGTLSGPDEGTQGCLLEITRGGTQPLQLSNGESRRYLEDGDEIRLHAFCSHQDGPRIGFGSCLARVVAAPLDN